MEDLIWIGSIGHGSGMQILFRLMTIHCQSPANLGSNFDWHRKTNRGKLISNPYQLKTNTVPIQLNLQNTPSTIFGYQLSANWTPIEIKILVHSQLNAYRQPIWCQLRTYLKTIETQSNSPQSNAN